MSLFWSPDLKFTRPTQNPRPPIPKLGWKPATNFPSLKAADVISFDVETYDPMIEDFGPGWARGVGHIIGIAIGTNDGYAQYFPMRHREGFNHDPDTVIRYAQDQLGRADQPKIGHNILYDLGWVEHEGIRVKGEIHDTWSAEKILNHSAEASLEATAKRHLGEGKESDALYDWAWSYWGRGEAKNGEKRKLAMKNLSKVPAELVGFYAESDVRLPPEIACHQFEKLEKAGLWDVYRMECDLIPLLVQMRLAGVSVDLNAAEEAFRTINKEIDELQRQINHIAGCHVNTGAPTEVGPVFDKLGIKYPLTEKAKKPQLKAEFLQTIDHPIGQLIVDIEELKKANSTFVRGYIMDSHVNGKVHGEFNPLRAVTGRMSASNPNLQNIPSRKEVAKKIRAIFVPDEGHEHWRKYDYSSIESRILAHYAVGVGADALRQEYTDNPDTDYHTFTQTMIKNLVGLELNRKHVKNVNFAGIYGASEKKLQRMMQLSDEEADIFFRAYHDGLPYVKETMNYISRNAEKAGHTRTILGRRALFDKWEPKYTERGQPRPFALPFKKAVQTYGPNIKRAYLHKALNYTIQGSAADLMKAGMVKCWKDGVFDVIGVPRLVVHDELDWSVPSGDFNDAFNEMKHIMETVISFKIPIKMEGEWGPNWNELYKIEG